MLSTNATNDTTIITICCIAIAATEKNNTNLLLLVGNTTTNSTVANSLCTNCNANTCPSDCGFVLGSLYMHCNLTNTLLTLLLLFISLIRSLLLS
jgi:hypothetical protein